MSLSDGASAQSRDWTTSLQPNKLAVVVQNTKWAEQTPTPIGTEWNDP